MRIYVSNDCPYCTKLKNGLNKEKIEFIEINTDLERNRAEVEKVFKLAGKPVVPIIILKPHLLVPDKSFKTIDEAIKLIVDLTK